ncbi:dihydrofolate reductase family protein [Nocardia sp. NPDC051030]|uniref:dihydrofolate reductase family protein n=1 Tax=Nocardia sp. NPDC051030 TaxID=3155162 RepID=UPI003429550E
MRKLIVSTYMTLDGKVDGIQDWAPAFNTDEAVKYHTELLADSDGLLLGRKTYDIFAAVWPSRAGQLAYADQLNTMPKYVASTTLEQPAWENSHLLEGDIPKAVAELKEQPGRNLILYGCHDLMHSLLPHDLIDEYRILVCPVLLGQGRSFLDNGSERVNLELVDSVSTASGMAINAYRPVR